MQVDRDEIEAGLPRKGFVKDDCKKGHRYFYHEYQGKRTGPFAYTSHGSGYSGRGTQHPALASAPPRRACPPPRGPRLR